MQTLVQPLFAGPIDILGDVHGEIDPLLALLHRLGYDQRGCHPDGRHLIFLGDLTDRGPNSPGVVKLVSSLVESGQAQCVLGNHDLNILLGKEKYDNDWFFGREFRPNGVLVPQVLADTDTREMVTSFFRTLPLALERPDVRVVHACWHPEMIEIARCSTSTFDLYHQYQRLIKDDQKAHHDLDEIDCKLARQNRNPVKVLTSGLEEKVAVPIEVSGKLRHEDRVIWWKEYNEPQFCIFGHYAIPFGQDRGKGRAICVDCGVGYRWKERLAGKQVFKRKLAALRFPEKELVFDDGTPSTWL